MAIITFIIILILESISVLYFALFREPASFKAVYPSSANVSIASIILISVALIFLINILIIIIKELGGKEPRLKKISNDEKTLWIIIAISFFASIIPLFLFVLGVNQFGPSSIFYAGLHLFLVWLTLISAQTFLFSLFWYCIKFTGVFSKKENQPNTKDFLLLTGLFIFFFLIKYFLFLPIGHGMLVNAELKYPQTAMYLNSGIFLQHIDAMSTNDPILYPLSLMFAFNINNGAFTASKILNALLTTSSILPIFLITRQIFEKKISYAIVIITSVIPLQLLMPIRLQSENLYFPLLLWAVYFFFVTPRNPKYRLFWDTLLGVWMGLMYLCRFITLAIIPFFLLVWWLKPFDDISHPLQIRWQKIRNLIIIILLIFLIFSPWILINLKNGFSVKYSLGFGITQRTNPEQLTIRKLLKWVVLNLSYFILLASPVLNLLFLLPKPKNTNNKLSLWYLLIIALSLAFLVAVIRHSWRAYYNIGTPLRIMGRYFVYFPVFFLITAMISIANFKKSSFKNFWQFAFLSIILPVILITISYLILIKGSIITINPYFILFEASPDAYYIKILGIGYFIIICILIILTTLLLWKGLPHSLEIISAGLILFYLVGQPKLMQEIIYIQKYQEIGAKISDMIIACNKNSGRTNNYIIYLPQHMTDSRKEKITNSIFIRNIGSGFYISRYDKEDTEQVRKGTGIIYYLLKYSKSKLLESEYLYIKDNAYIIEFLSKEIYCAPG